MSQTQTQTETKTADNMEPKSSSAEDDNKDQEHPARRQAEILEMERNYYMGRGVANYLRQLTNDQLDNRRYRQHQEHAQWLKELQQRGIENAHNSHPDHKRFLAALKKLINHVEEKCGERPVFNEHGELVSTEAFETSIQRLQRETRERNEREQREKEQIRRDREELERLRQQQQSQQSSRSSSAPPPRDSEERGERSKNPSGPYARSNHPSQNGANRFTDYRDGDVHFESMEASNRDQATSPLDEEELNLPPIHSQASNERLFARAHGSAARQQRDEQMMADLFDGMDTQRVQPDENLRRNISNLNLGPEPNTNRYVRSFQYQGHGFLSNGTMGMTQQARRTGNGGAYQDVLGPNIFAQPQSSGPSE